MRARKRPRNSSVAALVKVTTKIWSQSKGAWPAPKIKRLYNCAMVKVLPVPALASIKLWP